MRKHYPLDPVTGLENAALLPWEDGIPGTGVEGSFFGNRLFTDTEKEVLNLQAAAGIIGADADLTQSVQAMSRGIYFGSFGGSANALTATIGVAVPVILTAMRFWGRASATNTSGGVTLAISGFTTAPGALNVIRKDGTALQAGDLVSGLFYEFMYDGANLVCRNPTNEVLSVIQSQFIISTAITKTVGGSGTPDFADLNVAMAWISKYLISYTGSVTFQLAAGLFNYGTATVTVNHPNADRITIAGAALTSSPPTYSGLSVTGSSSGNRNTDGTANLSYLRGIFATELRFTPAVGGIYSSGKNPNFRNLLITSDGTGTEAGGANGLQIDGGAVLSNVALSGWGGAGILIRNAGVVVPSGTSVCVSACGASSAGGIDIQQGGELVYAGQVMVVGSGTHGARVTMGSLVQQGGAFSAGGNLLDGVNVQIGGAFSGGTSCTYARNGGQGISAYQGSNADVTSAAVGGNGGYGIYSDNATIIAKSATFPSTNMSGTIGATGPSARIDATSAGVNGTESPAVNGAGGISANGGAYIRN